MLKYYIQGMKTSCFAVAPDSLLTRDALVRHGRFSRYNIDSIDIDKVDRRQ